MHIVLLLVLLLSGCTVHVCGNSEVAHQVGDGTIGEDQRQKDSASADIKADVPVK